MGTIDTKGIGNKTLVKTGLAKDINYDVPQITVTALMSLSSKNQLMTVKCGIFVKFHAILKQRKKLNVLTVL